MEKSRNTAFLLSTTLNPTIVHKSILDMIDLTCTDEEVNDYTVANCRTLQLKCVVCKEIFTDSIELHKHATLAHSELKIFFCDLCTESFLCEKNMQAHKKTIHQIEHNSNTFLKLPAQQNQSDKTNKMHHTDNLLQTVSAKKLTPKNLNELQRRRSCRQVSLKSHVMHHKRQFSMRNDRHCSQSNLKSILRKYGCLKEVTIPLTRIDNQPLIIQEKIGNKPDKSSKIIVRESSKVEEKDDVFILKVKKCQDVGSVFTISRVDGNVDVKVRTEKLCSAMEMTVLKELINNFEKKDITNSILTVNNYKKDVECSTSDLPSLTAHELMNIESSNKVNKDFSNIGSQGVEAKLQNLHEEHSKNKEDHDSQALETQDYENVAQIQSSVNQVQSPINNPQDSSNLKGKNNEPECFTTATEICKTQLPSLINVFDSTKHMFYAPGYVSVLHPVGEDLTIIDGSQCNADSSKNTSLLPVHILSEQPLLHSDHLSLKIDEATPLKNITLLKKQDGSLVKSGESSNSPVSNQIRRIESKSPVFKETATQTYQEDDNMYAPVVNFVMPAMKSLSPVLIRNGKQVSNTGYENKMRVEAFVQLAEKPSENQIVSQIIGICCSCRGVSNLMRQLIFTRQSAPNKYISLKCPLCVEKYTTLTGIKQHLKKSHLPCAIMTGQKHLKVKVVDTPEPLYIPKFGMFILECFCCKIKFKDIMEFTKHIQLFHYHPIANISLQTPTDMSLYKDDFYITTDKHFENLECRIKDTLPPTDSEVTVEIPTSSNMKGDNANKEILLPVDNKKEVQGTVPATPDVKRTCNLQCTRNADGSSVTEQEVTKLIISPIKVASTNELNIPVKKLVLSAQTKDQNHELRDTSNQSHMKTMNKLTASTIDESDTQCTSKSFDELEKNIAHTAEGGSELTEADSTVLITTTHSYTNNPERGKKRKNSQTTEPVLQKRIKNDPPMNERSETRGDLNDCSSTSNANNVINADSTDSIDSSITMSSVQIIVTPKNTPERHDETVDSQESLDENLNEKLLSLQSIAPGDITVEPNPLGMEENPMEEQHQNENRTSGKEETKLKSRQKHLNRKIWRCPYCNDTFNALQNAAVHRYVKHNDDSIVHICDNCNTLLTSYAVVNMHLCGDVSSWKCRRCNIEFADNIKLRSHNIQKHLEKPGPQTCLMCNKNFLTMAMLDRHITAVHKKMQISLEGVKTTSTRKVPTFTPESNSAISSSVHCSGPKSYLLVTRKNSRNKVRKIVENKTSPDINPSAASANTLATVLEAKNAVAWQCDDKNTAYSLFDGDVYTCGICPKETNSKPGIKLHLKKQHKITAGECQLCNKLFDKDDLGSHLIGDHVIPRYSSDASPSVNYRDAESFLQLLGTDRLLTCCQYQRYVDQSSRATEKMTCPRCTKQFLNSRFYRIHFLWMHDNSCLLCNEDFKIPSQAVTHKVKVHNSIGTYIWAIEKIIQTLLDLGIYGETIDDVITELISREGPLSHGHASEEARVRGNEVDNILDAQEGDIPSTEELDDDKRLVLVITEQDIEKYKDNIKTLAQNLCANNEIFSQNYIENLLKNYLEYKKK